MLGLMSRLTQSMAHAQSAPRSLTSFLKLMDWYRCRCIYNMYLDVSEIRYLVRLRRLNQTNRLSNFIATPGRELRFLIKHQVSVDVVRPNKNFRCKVEASVGFFLWFIALSAQYRHVIILRNLCLSSGSSGLDKLFAPSVIFMDSCVCLRWSGICRLTLNRLTISLRRCQVQSLDYSSTCCCFCLNLQTAQST